MGPSAFYYYNPEQTADNRNHGHFTPHPQSMPMAAAHDYFAYQPAMSSYSRPQSAGPQVFYQPQQHYLAQAMLTPAASPKPRQHKPTFLVQQEMQCMMPIDTDCQDYHQYMPATPTLSAAGSFSSADSPQTAGPMPTPVEVAYLGSSFEGIKQGCEEEVFSEILTGGDWSRTKTPPMSPGMSIIKET